MPRYKLLIEYDGTPYAGWQRQPDRPSVQESLIDAVFKFSGETVDVVGAGRTDAGVHATAQVAHIDLTKEYEPFNVMQGINYYLFNSLNPADGEAIAQDPARNLDPVLHAAHCHRIVDNRIAVLKAERVPDDFSARFSGKQRHYLYRIINRRARLGLEAGRAWHVVEPLNVDAMQKAAHLLVGHHDFSSFRDTQCQSKSPEKTLEKLAVIRYGDEVRITCNARSFLHHQVRIMAGTLALVGKGRWQIEDVSKALAARKRAAGGPTAPPEGLYLVGVDY